jgi:hypothetical protein
MKELFSFKDHKIAYLFAVLSIGIVLFQTSRFWVLIDLSFILEHSYRMTLGDIIYKDFFIPYPPGTFLIQAFLIKVFGVSLYPQIIYCCLITFLTYLLTYRILFFFSADKWLNVSLAFPVSITGGYGIWSQPFYDPDYVFFILLSLFLILYVYENKFSLRFTVLAGAISVIPVFFKQNTGIIYVCFLHLALIITFIFKKSEVSFKQYLYFLLGSFSAVIVLFVYVSFTSGIGNYILSTFTIPSQTRLPEPMKFIQQNLSFVVLRNAGILLGAGFALKYLKLKNIWINIITFVLVLLPFYIIPLFRMFFLHQLYFNQFLTVWPSTIIVCAIAVFYSFVKLKDIPLFVKLIPVIILAVINAAFLSQGYWGSTYALWPLFSVLLALLFLILINSGIKKHIVLLKKIFIINSLAISVSMLIYVLLNYNNFGVGSFDIQGEVHRSTIPALNGLAVPGEYIPNLDNFLNFAHKEIPLDDPVIVIPHEDPFYFATGRKPIFPLYMFDWTLKINNPEEILKKAREAKVKWFIIKTKLQSIGMEGFINLELLISLFKKDFILYKVIPGYEIYRKSN